jgi:hypothetical protein
VPNPLMQPTNAGGARRRPRPSLPAATTDRRLSRARLQVISHSLGSYTRDHLMRSSWPINRLYSTLVVVIVLVAGGYLCWEVGSHAARGAGGSLEGLTVVVVFALAVGWAAEVGWSLYVSSRTSFDEHSISQPGLMGPKVLRWTEIKSVQQRPGALRLSDGRIQIVVAPFRHRDPAKVLSDVRSRAPTLSATRSGPRD